MSDLPSRLSEVTTAWLDEQLAAAGHDLPPIAAVAVEPMHGFVGALGEVAVLRVDWEGGRGALPASFVAKCPLDDDTARLYNSVMQFYGREHGFYRDLASEVDMRIPQCWINRYDPDSGAAFLMLEHIDAAHGDVLEGCDVATMTRLVGDLARMHGRFWMDDRLQQLPWLMDWRADSLELGIEITRQAWRDLAVAEPLRYPLDLFRVLARSWIDDTEAWLERYARRPWTLTHLDYELDNILLADDGPVVLDWQSVMRSHPGVDLGWMLATSHNAETLDAEPDLLSHYRAELAAAGGPSWSAEDLQEELAWGMLYPAACQPLPYSQDFSGYGGAADRMHRRFEKFLQGSIDAAVRWNLVGHIGPLAAD